MPQNELFPDFQPPNEPPAADLDVIAAGIAASAPANPYAFNEHRAAQIIETRGGEDLGAEQVGRPPEAVLPSVPNTTGSGGQPTTSEATSEPPFKLDARFIGGRNYLCAILPDGRIIASRELGSSHSPDLYDYVAGDANSFLSRQEADK